MDDTNQSDKNQKMVLKSIAKWLVIFALIAFVCYKNQDLMQEALEEIQITPVWKLVMCLLLGNLYFIAEGCIISEMTNTCDHRLSVWQEACKKAGAKFSGMYIVRGTCRLQHSEAEPESHSFIIII